MPTSILWQVGVPQFNSDTNYLELASGSTSQGVRSPTRRLLLQTWEASGSLQATHILPDLATNSAVPKAPGASLMAQTVKNLPAMRETQVWSLGWEDPPEKGMASHSSILAGRIPWTEEPGGQQPMESKRFGHNWVTNTFTFFFPHDP